MSERDAGIYTLVFTRMELTWLMRQMEAGRDRADGIIKTYSGDVISRTKLADEQRAQLDEAQQHRETLERLVQDMKDRLAEGERQRLAIYNMKMDLEEAFDLVDEDSGKQEVMNRLKQLPKQEDYRIQFDRTTIKFTLKLIENDLHKFRSQIIPNYEKAPPEQFEDPIQTKSYWVNKARKSKEILESLKSKLEKKL